MTAAATGPKPAVAFLGLGRMGVAMAVHLAEDGVALTVWNRSAGRAGELTALGAREAASVADAVADAEVVVLMLTGPGAVHEVATQIASAAAPGTLVIDASTIGPDAARATADLLADRGIHYVDAPVAGSVQPARDRKLGTFLGGSDADVERARPVVAAWAEPDRILHTGAVGTGSALKLVVNLSLGITAQGVGEALALADALGVDSADALAALSKGPFGILLGQKGRMLADDDFSATSFSVDLVAKDLDLALAKVSADAVLPASRAALASAEAASAAGHGGEDFARLIAQARAAG